MRAANGALVVSVLATMVVFSAVELWVPAEAFYRHSMGVLQWPFRAVVALCRWGTLPGIAPVGATADATDLVALPMGLVALAFGLRRASPRPERALGAPQAAQRTQRTRWAWSRGARSA